MELKRKYTFSTMIKILAGLTLIAAWLAGSILRNKEVRILLEDILPSGTELSKLSDNPRIYKAQNPTDASISGYCVINQAQGWGGPLRTATFIDFSGQVKNVIILEHRETPTFFNRLQKKDFLQQFTGKSVSAPFLPGQDIDIVTQATISSRALTTAVRQGSHAAGRSLLGLQIEEEKRPWQFGIKDIILLVMFAVLLLSVMRKIKALKYLSMIAFFLYLGFYLNSSLSIAHFGSLLLGYAPSPLLNTFWWILVGGAILTALLLRKNLYCLGMCPFGNLQEFNSRISGINLDLSPTIAKTFRHLSSILVWLALAIIFLTSNPALGAFEPFPTLFGLQGTEIQWFILPVVLLGSFLFTRFFCRFFCPVGIFLNTLIKIRCQLDKMLTRKTKCPE